MNHFELTSRACFSKPENLAHNAWCFPLFLFVGLWISLMVNGRELYLHDPGTFFHTAVGEKILTDLKLPTTDQFTFTSYGKPWIASQWLAETAMALVHRVAGLDGLLLTSVLLLSLVYGFVGCLFFEQGLHPLLTILFVFIVLAASTHHFLVRPHLLTIALSAVVFKILLDVETREKGVETLFFLPVIMAVWSNLHGGAIGGIASTFLVIGGWLFAPIFRRKTPLESGKARLIAVAAGVLSGLAPLVNPFGAALPATWQTILSSPSVAEHIKEHAGAINFWYGRLTLGLGLLYCIILLLTNPGSRRVVWFLPLAWLVLTISRVRNGPLFAVTAGIALADMFTCLRLSGKFFENRSFSWILSGKRKAAFRPVLFLAGFLWIAGMAFSAMGIEMPLLGRGWARLDPSWWPTAQLAHLRSFASERPSNAWLFNEMLFGGFLTFFVPSLQTFIDDRCELAGEEGIKSYIEAEKNPEIFAGLEKKWNFRAALTIPGSGFDDYFKNSPEWKLICGNAAANFYRKPDF